MLALIQRVQKASVTIHTRLTSEIGAGYVILLGIYESDTDADILKLVPKILNLRIMSDEAGKLNKSILDTKGEILLVSQFTLCADTSAGRRPSFIKAKKPDEACHMYEYMRDELKKSGLDIKTGEFGADMKVSILNDGPVTILLNSNDF